MATQINLTTGSGTSSISLSTGARGPAGADGAAGAAGTNGTNGSDATVTAANVASAMSGFDGTQAGTARTGLEIILSTTGGASKVIQSDASSFLKTGATNASQGVTPAGGLRIPAQQRITWEDHNGDAVGNVWAFPNHGSDFDASYYAELVQSFPRWCWYWTDGMQLGDAPAINVQRGFRHAYLNPLGQAHAAGTFLSGQLDTVVESVSLQFRGSWWTGTEARTAAGAIQFIPSGVNTGELAFYTGGQPTASTNQLSPGGTSAWGRMGSHGGFSKSFGVTELGPKIPSGKVLTFGDGTTMSTAGGGSGTVTEFSAGTTGFSVATATTTPTLSGTLAVANGGTGTTTGSITPTGDYSITQNSVPVIVSDSASAITNSIRVSNGKLRVGNSGSTSAAGVPFEVRTASDAAATNTTVGSLYVDTNGTVRVGRMADSDTNGRLIVQNRVGTASFEVNASTNTASFASTLATTFANATDSTSSTTGAVKITGGVGIAKKLYVGTGLNVAAPTVPASAGATGTAGDIAWDADYIYICTATNTWKRVAIATW